MAGCLVVACQREPTFVGATDRDSFYVACDLHADRLVWAKRPLASEAEVQAQLAEAAMCRHANKNQFGDMIVCDDCGLVLGWE